ncbi:MAG: ComEC family competence protein, partial [Candidatus Marinimicrobia bacterium]|nr:ComEC family competence protein [Candidatus Neomarinimicrobiota bacterium]
MIDRIVGLLSPRPMVVVSLAFMLGILLEQTLRIGPLVILLLMLVVAVGLFVPKVHSWGIIVILLLLSGSLRLATHQLQPNSSLAKFTAQHDSIYQVTAIVGNVGETRKGTPKYTLSPELIDQIGISHGSMILYAKDLLEIPEIGDTLIAPMLLNQPREQRNPHEFNYAYYLEKQGIFLEGFIDDVEQVVLHRSLDITTAKLMLTLRDLIKYHFLKDLSPRSAGIMSALILGERSDVDDQIKSDFANTGVIHVLAVSGLHVGYISLILITMIGILRIAHRPKTLLVILGLGFYVILTGGAASVMRASIMAGLILTANLIERKTYIFNILATAALLILLIDPMQLGGIGFQLSFSAVLSIVMLFPILREWIPKFNPKSKLTSQ